MGTQLRIVDPEQEHPLDVARRRLREYRLRRTGKAFPIEVHVPEEIRPKDHLDVDEVLKKSLPDHVGKTI